MPRLALGGLLALAAAGCGSPPPVPPATVRGMATFQGRPLAGGLVCFAPDREKGCSGKVVSAVVQPDGGFRLPEGIAPGWYRVALADPPEWAGSDWERAFPSALRRPDLSGLEREVKPGGNHVFDFPVELRE